ncbi:MAG TPA: glycosyltransferase family 4 protein [Sphingomonas sp.]|nr:glycosyltransferase family 4 protein [Sphingomonas sp.]
MKALRIAQVGSRGIPGHRGGVERVIEAVAPRLAAMGHEVTVYCADWAEDRPEEWRGVKLAYTKGIASKYFDTISRSVLATLREAVAKHDIVHYHSSGSAPLAILPRLFGKKVVVTVHGMDWQRRKWNVFGKYFLQLGEWAAIRFPHRTIVVGPDLKTWLDTKYKSDVTYIPNGVEERVFRAPTRLAEKGVEARKYVLFLARLVPEKQVHTLIEAWMRLADKHGMTLAIAGPSWHSVDYAESLKRQAADDPSVSFLGEVDEEMLEQLYSNCYAYVLPSEVEGMSLSLLDGMAFGACVICSDIAPNLAVIGDAGLSFRVLDATDLRARLSEIMADPDRAEHLRIAARKRIIEEFTWDRVAQRWADLYLDVVS